MNKEQFEKYNDIPKEKFAFASTDGRLHDQKLDTKAIGYFQDAWNRFKKNKSSIVAAAIVIFLIIFAAIGPYCFSRSYQQAYTTDYLMQRYQYLLPKLKFMEGTGIWDGTKTEEMSRTKLYILQGIEKETGKQVVIKAKQVKGSNNWKVRYNTYNAISSFEVQLTADKYQELQQYQKEHNVQVILPYVDNELALAYQQNKNIWYECDRKGSPKLANGKLVPAYLLMYNDDYTGSRIAGDPGIKDPSSPERYRYAFRSLAGGTSGDSKVYNYTVRVDAYEFFIYRYGFEPSFMFGTDVQGYDIFTRLASGARFSMLFALCVSIINLTIGAIYGSIEGYYGGATDMIMERISDILSSIPTMVVTVLFNLHLSAKVGVVPALLYAFVLTGWIGMASRVRMQFYRFKNQEYVLAARTLGAKDRRIMFKHIFPNSLGTIITGSVLVIPSVIFSETSLTYLGIINLDSPTRSSVGAMLSSGQGIMTRYPHVVFFPALFIALLMICFNLFGNGLRDAFNPSLRGAED